MSKFKVGDTVRVIKYGHGIYMPRSEWKLVEEYYHTGNAPDHVIEESKEGWFYDMSPEMIGRIGVVDRTSSNGSMYSLTEIVGKNAWYWEHQLELVTPVEKTKMSAAIHEYIVSTAKAIRKYIEANPEEFKEQVLDKDLLKEMEEFGREDEFEKWIEEVINYEKRDIFATAEDEKQALLLEQVLAKYKKFKKEGHI